MTVSNAISSPRIAFKIPCLCLALLPCKMKGLNWPFFLFSRGGRGAISFCNAGFPIWGGLTETLTVVYFWSLDGDGPMQPYLLQKLQSPVWRKTKDDTAPTNPDILSCWTLWLEFESHQASILPTEMEKRHLGYFIKVCIANEQSLNT